MAFASLPWKVTIAILEEFPKQPPSEIKVLPGNTVTWHCPLPKSNPEASIEYYNNGEFFVPVYQDVKIKSLVIPSVQSRDAGRYTCKATNTMESVSSNAYLELKVVPKLPFREPYFAVEPSSRYTALKGD